jgi:hypothetical protein
MFEPGQTLWWLRADSSVVEVTFSHYVPGEFWLASLSRWYVKPAGKAPVAAHRDELYTDKETVCTASLKRLADKDNSTWKVYIDDVQNRREKLEAAYQEADNDPNGV